MNNRLQAARKVPAWRECECTTCTTFGRRLREAGVTVDDRALLLGHAVEGMLHDTTATVCATRRVGEQGDREPRDRTTLSRVING